MEPTIHIGDIVFFKEANDIQEQDIIAFQVNHSIVTHRVVKIQIDENDEKQYTTKGDANSSEDIETITDELIEGKYWFRIGKVGSILLFLRTHTGIGILAIIFIASLLFIPIDSKEKERKKGRKYKGKHTL